MVGEAIQEGVCVTAGGGGGCHGCLRCALCVMMLCRGRGGDTTVDRIKISFSRHNLRIVQRNQYIFTAAHHTEPTHNITQHPQLWYHNMSLQEVAQSGSILNPNPLSIYLLDHPSTSPALLVVLGAGGSLFQTNHEKTTTAKQPAHLHSQPNPHHRHTLLPA